MIFFRHPLPPVLICALLWGSAFPVIKTVYHQWDAQGLTRTLPLILLFAGIRFSIAGTGLLLVGKNLRQELKAASWKGLLLLALTQTFIQYLFFYQAVAISSASLAALLVATGSFWWMLLAPLFLKSPWPNTRQWLGLILGGTGVTLAVYAPGINTGNPILGALFMLSATASGALAVITFQKLKTTISSKNATGFSLLLGGIGLILVGAPALDQLSEMFSPIVIFATLWLCLVSAAAFSIWNHLSTLFPVTLLASYRFLIPIAGVIEALIFLPNERPGWGLVIGGALVILSMIWAQKTSSSHT